MTVALVYDGRLYHPQPRMATWLEMEDELGSLPAFCRRMANGEWRLTELVVAVQILLAAAGCDCDLHDLGDDMLRRGMESYRQAVEQLMRHATGQP